MAIRSGSSTRPPATARSHVVASSSSRKARPARSPASALASSIWANGLWANDRLENWGRLPAAMATSSSRARRPMPSATAAMPDASSAKLGNAASGESIVGRVTPGCSVRASRHEHVLDGEVQRTGAPQPRRVPRVVERDVGGGEEAQPERVVVAAGAAEDPLAVLGAAPPRPAAGDVHAAVADPSGAVGREHAAGDGIGRPEHLLGDVGSEERGHRRRGRGDAGAPAGGAVAGRHPLDGLDHRHRVEPRAAVVGGEAQAGQAALDERGDRHRRQPPLRLGLVGVVPGDGRDPVGRRQHAGAGVRHRPSAHRVPDPAAGAGDRSPAERWATLHDRPCCTSTSWGRPRTRSATMLRWT